MGWGVVVGWDVVVGWGVVVGLGVGGCDERVGTCRSTGCSDTACTACGPSTAWCMGTAPPCNLDPNTPGYRADQRAYRAS